MKYLMAGMAALTLSQTAFSTTILTAERLVDSDSEVWIADEFHDSTFDYDRENPDFSAKDFCFAGQLEDVCTVLSASIDKIRLEFEAGDHDAVELLDCSTKKNGSAHTTYRLFDDYGANWQVSRVIRDCGSNSDDVAVFSASVVNGQTSLLANQDLSGVPENAAVCFVGDAQKVCDHLKKDSNWTTCNLDPETLSVQAEYRVEDAEGFTTLTHHLTACVH